MNSTIQIEEVNIFINILKVYCVGIFAHYFSIKIVNKHYARYKKIIIYIIIGIISIICGSIRWAYSFLNSIIALIFLLSIIFAINTKNDIGYSLCITAISLSLSYILFFIAVCISYIPNVILNINNDYINFIILNLLYIILSYLFLKINRFKRGFAFLQKNLKNDYFDILILNTSIIILFSIIILSNYNEILSDRIFWAIIAFSIIMFITIQKSLQMYYKQKLLIQELNETKEELKQKKLEIEELEKENLNFSKISHSVAHKQKSLEHKLNELILKSEIASQIEVKNRLKNVNKEMQQVTVVKLQETNISEIDDMLSYMQSECSKSRIDFQIQLNGNIHYMINNYIDKEKLEILLADHIKNAIIAINYTETNNRSILLRLGMIEGIYSVNVYDSGIEFEVETLANLGEKPTTTHGDTGGTGIGFMNTFDTLKQYQASMIICEYGKPCQDNFTKCIQIKFDKKNEFKICSYRVNELQNGINKKEVQIEKIEGNF